MNELPISWQLIDIAAVTDVIGGGTPSTTISEYYTNDHEKGIAWITPADLSGYTDKYIAHGRRSITKKGYNASSARIMPKGTVLFSSRAPIGYTVIAANDISTNQGFKSFVPNEGVDSKYLYYYLKSIKYLAESVAAGTTFKELSGKMAKTLPFPLAPLAEQKRIVEKLDEVLAQVDAIKTRLDNVPEILKRFRQSVLAAAVSGKLTEEWRQKNTYTKWTINNFNMQLSNSNFKAKSKYLKQVFLSKEVEGWLNLSLGNIFNVKSGDGLTAKEMNPEGLFPVYGGNGINGYHDSYNQEKSKIVIGRVGFYCGSVHRTPNKSWVTDNALIVDFPTVIDQQYSYWLLKATDLRADSSSTAQPVISGSKIYPIELHLPHLEEQEEIVRLVEQYFAFADTIEKQVAKAQVQVNNLTQSILKKAFSGKLVAQNPNDKPAEQLLAKIAKARKEAEAIEKAAKKIKK